MHHAHNRSLEESDRQNTIFLKTKAFSEMPQATYKARPDYQNCQLRGVMLPVRFCGRDHGITTHKMHSRMQNQEMLPSCRVRSLSRGQCSEPVSVKGILFLHRLASSTRGLDAPAPVLREHRGRQLKKTRAQTKYQYKHPSKPPFLFHTTPPGAMEAAQAKTGNGKQTLRV